MLQPTAEINARKGRRRRRTMELEIGSRARVEEMAQVGDAVEATGLAAVTEVSKAGGKRRRGFVMEEQVCI